MVGGIIGSYRILSRIGEGGMGTVYLGEHTLIGRHAAIKVLLRELSWQQDLVTRFFNEARAATAVKHPGIVEIYDFGYHTDGSAYIVMEYLEGESLALRLKRLGTFSEARVVALGRQVAGALGAAHAKGIVHRDLKPDNIYIVRDPDLADGERTKILDFGIAKLTGSEGPGQSMTRADSVMGTPGYMSPEQCKGAGNVDYRTDLYALGCILFEMVCGRPPFTAEGGGEVMAQHIFAPVPRPSSFRPVSPRLEQVILHALAKEPSQRFQSSDEMAAALRSAAAPGIASASEPMYAAPAQPVTGAGIAGQPTTLRQASAAVATASGATPRRSWRVPVIAAISVAIGAGAMALGMRGRDDAAPVAKQAAAEAPPAPPASPTASAVSPRSTPGPGDPASAAAPSVPGPASAASTAGSSAQAPASAPPAAPAPSPAAAPSSSPAAPARVTIKLTSEPSGADVYRTKGARIGRTPFEYTTEAGGALLVLTFKKSGYADKQTSVPADHDTEHKVTLAKVAKGASSLVSAPAAAAAGEPAAPASGSLNPFEKLAPKPKEQ